MTTANIRVLLIRQSTDLIRFCNDYRSSSISSNDDFDINGVKIRFRQLRDALEDFSEAAITPQTRLGPVASSLAATEPYRVVANELLSKCRQDMNGMELELKQLSCRQRVGGPLSSTGLEEIVSGLSSSTTALKD